MHVYICVDYLYISVAVIGKNMICTVIKKNRCPILIHHVRLEESEGINSTNSS
jgi:hypothetical protein